MLKNSEQVLPLSATVDPPFISAAKACRRRWFSCCGCAAVLLLIMSTIAVTLASTVFRLRGPIVRVGNLTVGSFLLTSRRNVTLSADVWVRNPNFASIDYGGMTTTLFYRGVAVGESRAPPGRARARRTETIGATAVIMADRVLSQPDLGADFASGLVNVSSFTRVGGKIDLGVFEKHVTMRMNCNVSINVTSRSIQHHKCRRRIKL